MVTAGANQVKTGLCLLFGTIALQGSFFFVHCSLILSLFLYQMQAFVNLVLILCDPGDSVVMFEPYYFNAYMAFQMTGVTNIIVGPGHPETLYPDAGTSLTLSHIFMT